MTESIEEGRRNLDAVRSDLKKYIKLWLEEQQKVRTLRETLMEEGNARNGSFDLASAKEQRDKTHAERVACEKNKMLQELDLRLQQKDLAETQLKMLTLDDFTEEFLAWEKKTDQFKQQVKKTETELNLISEKVLQLKEDEKILERNVEIETMYSNLANSEVSVSSIRAKILNLETKKNYLKEKIKKRISDRRASEMKLWKVLYHEAKLKSEIKEKNEFESLSDSAESTEAIAKICI